MSLPNADWSRPIRVPQPIGRQAQACKVNAIAPHFAHCVRDHYVTYLARTPTKSPERGFSYCYSLLIKQIRKDYFMDRFAIFLDAGYFFSAGAQAITGSSTQRKFITLKAADKAVEAL